MTKFNEFNFHDRKTPLVIENHTNKILQAIIKNQQAYTNKA